jgi:hypothetical protein
MNFFFVWKKRGVGNKKKFDSEEKKKNVWKTKNKTAFLFFFIDLSVNFFLVKHLDGQYEKTYICARV